MTEPTPFDAKKALREEIQGLGDVRATILRSVRQSEKNMAEAEAEHGAVVKLLGFADAELARKREVLNQLVAEENK